MTSRHDYLPFGEEILQGEDDRGSSYPASTGSTTDGVNQKFTGKERDYETFGSATQADDYFGARYYSASLGRFTSPDWSALPQPVPYAKLTDPETLNLYGYVRNNPLAITDVDGHDGHQRCKGPDGNMVNCSSAPPTDKKAITKGVVEVAGGIGLGIVVIATAPASGAVAGTGAALGLLGAVSSYGKGVIDIAKGMGKFEDSKANSAKEGVAMANDPVAANVGLVADPKTAENISSVVNGVIAAPELLKEPPNGLIEAFSRVLAARDVSEGKNSLIELGHQLLQVTATNPVPII